MSHGWRPRRQISVSRSIKTTTLIDILSSLFNLHVACLVSPKLRQDLNLTVVVRRHDTEWRTLNGTLNVLDSILGLTSYFEFERIHSGRAEFLNVKWL